MTKRYYRLSRSLSHNEMHETTKNPYEMNINYDQDWYVSLYTYDEAHHAEWLKTRSFKGFRGVTTDKIFFDFDSKDNLAQAKADALEVISRLVQYDVPKNDIQVCFSGSKGFSVQLKTDKEFTPDELKVLTSQLAKGLTTYDPIVYDSQRIIRMLGTKHPSSGLYKIPLSVEELDEMEAEEIKHLAKDKDVVQEAMQKFSWQRISLPSKIYEMRVPIVKHEVTPKNSMILDELNLNDKPRWMPACKFAMQEGFFEVGHRRESALILAATYKAQGFHFDMIYRMLKGVAQKQADVKNCERLEDEEIYRVTEQVFDRGWKGGQFSCKNHPILSSICESLGSKACKHNVEIGDEFKPKTIIDLNEGFKHYVKNIDKNTIITGIQSIDDNVFISTGANVGVLGAAGSGKSAFALEVLSNTSKSGVKSVFASLDMHNNRMYEKVLYKVSGLPRDKLYRLFEENNELELIEKVKNEFGNVNFFNKSCPSVKDVRDYIIRCQDESGEKIKLVMLDYFERVSSDYSDDTQASKRVAGELQDLVNDLDIALITLVQPNKIGISGGADSPLHSYTNIKGSSFVYQAFRIIMSIWRPFYNPKNFSNDRFMQMAVLKNDLGELNEFSFAWDGPRGEIRELDSAGEEELSILLREKAEEAGNKKEGNW